MRTNDNENTKTRTSWLDTGYIYVLIVLQIEIVDIVNLIISGTEREGVGAQAKPGSVAKQRTGTLQYMYRTQPE